MNFHEYKVSLEYWVTDHLMHFHLMHVCNLMQDDLMQGRSDAGRSDAENSYLMQEQSDAGTI